MKLLRYGQQGEEKPGILDGQGRIRDVSKHIHDYCPSTLADKHFLNQLSTLVLETLPIVEVGTRIGPPISAPGKLVCVGFNSALHTEQLGVSPFPEGEMLIFLKATSAICGPHDPIYYTRFTKKLDWEAELAIVIGKEGKYIDKSEAHNHILGYTCMNDLSERYLQFEVGDSQFTKGKCFDHGAPLGPYIVTKEEVENPGALEVNLWVNQNLRQAFNTKDYIHQDADIISYISQFFTLYPGDIISMGSAPGNAEFWGESEFLKPGDEVSLSILGIGAQKQTVILEPS